MEKRSTQFGLLSRDAVAQKARTVFGACRGGHCGPRMNNNAFGTIAGLQKAHYRLTYGTVFPGETGDPNVGPNYAEIARAYGAEGVRIFSANELPSALKAAIASGKPTVLDVAMINNPTPTTGHWNILDIYSPGEQVSHAST